MKYYILGISLLLGICASAQQEVSRDYKNSFQFIPTKINNHIVGLGYERVLNPTTNLVLLSELIYFEERIDYQKGYEQRLAIKKHVFAPKSISGFSAKMFFMPYLEFGFFDFQNLRSNIDTFYDYEEADNEDSRFSFLDKREFTEYGGGILVGIEAVAFHRFSLEFYFGGGVKYNTFKEPTYPGGWDPYHKTWLDDPYRYRWEKKGIVPMGNIEFGYKF